MGVGVLAGLRAHETLRDRVCVFVVSRGLTISLAETGRPLGMTRFLPSMTLGETTFLRRRLQTRVGGAA